MSKNNIEDILIVGIFYLRSPIEIRSEHRLKIRQCILKCT